MQKTVVVTNARAGRSLSDPDKLARLCPFFSGGYTVKGTALLGLTRTAVYIAVQQLRRAGLLERELPGEPLILQRYPLQRKCSEKA